MLVAAVKQQPLARQDGCAMRFFNTAGPTNCQKHYCVPPLTRFNLDDILGMIDRERFLN
jgi:hypothetical protein